MKQAITQVIEWVHFQIFKREMSPMMREFVASTSWSFVGVFVSAAIFFALNVTAGRLLGPEGYGRYNLVVAIAASLNIFMGLGFDATAVKFMAEFTDPEKKWAAMSNSFIFVIPFSLVTAGILLLLRDSVGAIFHVDGGLIAIALLFTVLMTYKNLLNGFVQALKQFKYQALVKAGEAVVALLAFLILFFVLPDFRSYQGYLYALCLGSAASAFVFFMSVRKGLRAWNKVVFKEERPYLHTFQLFTVVGIIMASADRFFVAHYLGPQELGMYSAYLFSATIIVAQFILVVDNVFFPMVNQIEDKQLMARNVHRFVAVAFIPTMVFTTVVSYCIIRLFGSQYPVNWLYIGMVGFVAYLQIVTSMYISLLASAREYFRVSTAISYAKPFIFGGLYALSVAFNQVSIPVVLGILALSYIFDIVNSRVTFHLVPAMLEKQEIKTQIGANPN